MRYAQLTDSIAVAGQISIDDVPQIAAAGYQVLVNNRPDGEDEGQPSAAEVEAAALAAGQQAADKALSLGFDLGMAARLQP